jgi:hypothetical protein
MKGEVVIGEKCNQTHDEKPKKDKRRKTRKR